MIGDLNTSVATISPESLDALFSETPDNQVNANNLNLPTGNDKPLQVSTSSNFNVETIDLDKLDEVKTETKPKEEEKTEEEVEKVEEVKKPEEVKKEEEKTEEEKAQEETLLAERKALLKTSVQYLIEKGLFKDFEGSEELEVTDDIFAQLLEKQVEAKVDELYTSRKKSTGEFGEAVLEYVENGGDADKLIDLFKERKAIEEFDISTDDSKKALVTKWYKEVHGWKSDKINKYLNTLEAEDNALDSEAEEIKSKYEENYKHQLQELQQQQLDYNKAQQEKQKVFESNISKVIDSNQEFDSKRKQLLKNSIFKFKTLEDGTKVNDFYLKFAEWQNDPSKYIELAEFILDKDGYLKRKAIEVENKVTDKTFNFIKRNGTLDKNKGSNHVEKGSASSSKESGTDFSVIFK